MFELVVALRLTYSLCLRVRWGGLIVCVWFCLVVGCSVLYGGFECLVFWILGVLLYLAV